MTEIQFNSVDGVKLTTRDRLLLCILNLRHNFGFTILAHLFNIHEGHARRVFHAVVDVLFELSQKYIILPSKEERDKEARFFRGWKISVVVDGSEQPCSKSNDTRIERHCFSGKKHLHTFTKLLFVSPQGKIYMMSRSQGGSFNDMGLIALEENHLWRFLSPDEIIIGDKGFQGLHRYNCPSLTPYKKFHGYLTPDEQYFNRDFASIRIVVENVFAQIKKWRCCADRFRWQGSIVDAKERHHKIWSIVGMFVNRFTKPLRTNN